MEAQSFIFIVKARALQKQTAFLDYCNGPDVVLHATTSLIVCIVSLAAAIICYSNHPRCTNLRSLAGQKLGRASNKNNNQKSKHKYAQSMQAAARGYLQRQTYLHRIQACTVIQSRIRGIIVRSILTGQGLPTLARAVVQEDNHHHNVHQDCRNLIAAFQEKKQESFDSQLRDQSVKLFGKQVKAVMEVRMRLLAAVVLQSWIRMMKCRITYRQTFSSLNTAVITNLPLVAASPKGAATHDLVTHISSLSSWSSTWNRRQSSTVDSLLLSKSSSLGPMLFRPSLEEKEALKESIGSYASSYASIVKIQASWRTALVRHRRQRQACMRSVMSDETVESPTPMEMPPTPMEGLRRTREGSYASENTIRRSNLQRSKDHLYRRSKQLASTRRPKRRHRNGYYADMWKSALEQVGECHTTCSATLNSTASMDPGNAMEMARSTCDGAQNYDMDMIWTNVTGAADDVIQECSAIPSTCVAEAQKQIEADGLDRLRQERDSLLKSTKVNAIKLVDQISSCRKPRRGGSKYDTDIADQSLYLVQTVQTGMGAMEVEPLSSAASTAQSVNVFSSPSSMIHEYTSAMPYTFSTPSSCTFQSFDETDFDGTDDGTDFDGTDEDTSDDNGTAKQERRIPFGFCVAPAPSMSTTSEGSNTDRSGGDSYYSIDDMDLRTDDEEESYGPFPIKMRNRGFKSSVKSVH